MTSTGKIGFRMSNALWRRYAEIVGNAGRSSDLCRYLEWRADHPAVVLEGAADPGADGSAPHKIRVHPDIQKPYVHLFQEDGGRVSVDIRTYIAWRVANPSSPLPGKTRPPLKIERR
jgi:hypothetical protein